VYGVGGPYLIYLLALLLGRKQKMLFYVLLWANEDNVYVGKTYIEAEDLQDAITKALATINNAEADSAAQVRIELRSGENE
jgi:hypothetical protein